MRTRPLFALCVLLVACPEAGFDALDAAALDAGGPQPVDARPIAAPDAAAEGVDASFGVPDASRSADASEAGDSGAVDSGAAGGPSLLLAPNELDFGSQAFGCCSRERTFTLYNAGASSATLVSIELEQEGTAFSVTQAPRLPYELAPGAPMDAKVKFCPVDLGGFEATLVWATSAGRRYEARLSGQGALQQAQEDVFAQDYPNQADLLVVVDDSASMAGKRQAVIDNLAASVSSWISCWDVRLAFTTTSVDAALGGPADDPDAVNGRFLPLGAPGPRYLANAAATAAAIDALLPVGAHSDGEEMALRPILLALTEPLLSSENAGFLRPWAALEVLVITDGQDHDAAPVADYVALLDGLKPARWAYVSAVLPMQEQAPDGCSYDPPDAATSTRIAELVDLRGGGTLDICDPNWADRFAMGCLAGWGFRTRFYLSNPPDLERGTLSVAIDSVDVPEVDPAGTRRWSYNAADIAIDFASEELAPPPGSTTVVRYTVPCQP